MCIITRLTVVPSLSNSTKKRSLLFAKILSQMVFHVFVFWKSTLQEETIVIKKLVMGYSAKVQRKCLKTLWGVHIVDCECLQSPNK